MVPSVFTAVPFGSETGWCCRPARCGRELYADDPGQRLVGLEYKMLATSVEPHGTNLSGQVADVCETCLRINRKANGLVVVSRNHGHVTASLAHCGYRGLVQGVAARRIAAVGPINRVGLRIEFQIDGFGKLRPEDLNFT